MTTATVAPHAGRYVAAETGSPFTGVPSLLRVLVDARSGKVLNAVDRVRRGSGEGCGF